MATPPDPPRPSIRSVAVATVEAKPQLAENPLIKFWLTMTPEQEEVAEHLLELDRQELERRAGTPPGRRIRRMMPPAATLLDAYERARSSWGAPLASVRAVRAALDAARELAAEALEEPAALLFAFASYRRAFPGGWRFMAQSIAAQQARSLGYEPRRAARRLLSPALLRDVRHGELRRRARLGRGAPASASSELTGLTGSRDSASPLDAAGWPG